MFCLTCALVSLEHLLRSKYFVPKKNIYLNTSELQNKKIIMLMANYGKEKDG